MPTFTLKNNALTTLARLKAFLEISQDKHDGRLTMLINGATSFIEGYCGRKFKSDTYTDEVYNGTGGCALILKQWPVSALSRLQFDAAVDGNPSWETMESSQYRWQDHGEVRLIAGEFIQRDKKYRATYTAGYLIDFDHETDGSLHTLPFELEYACMKLVSAMFNKRKAHGVTQQSVGSESVNFMANAMSDDELKAILDGYKKQNVGLC